MRTAGGVMLGGRVGAHLVSWLARSWWWSLPALALAALVGWLWPVAGLALASLVLVPALLAVTVGERWPIAWERAACDPLRRLVWTVWLALRWSSACRSVHLGVWRETSKGRRFRAARIRPRVTRSGLLLRLRVPAGQGIEDVTRCVPRLAAAMRAYSVDMEHVSASVCRVRLVMRDALTSPVGYTQPSAFGPIRLGMDEDGHPVEIDPVSTGHLAVQGRPGSGKSTTSYVISAGLAARPDAVVVGCDPSGLLLAPWRHGRGGEWIATGTADMERHAAVLEAVAGEIDARCLLLVSAGRDKFEHFDAGFPMIWVALEEWPGLLAAARRTDPAIAKRIEDAAGRIAAEGRKCGVRVLYLAQRMSSRAIDTDDRANLAVRISHAVADRETVAMLHDMATAPTPAEMRAWRAGMGVVDRPGHPARRWRACWLSYDHYRVQVVRGLALHSLGWTASPLPASPLPLTTAGTEAPPRRRPPQPKQPRQAKGEVAA